MRDPDNYRQEDRSTIVDRMHFPSKLEADVYRHLKFKEASGLIKNLQRYGSVEFEAIFNGYGKQRSVHYKPDFAYQDMNGNPLFAEAKPQGRGFQRWLFIRKMWKAYGPCPLEVYGTAPRGVYLYETIVPDPRMRQFLEHTGIN